MSQRSSDTEPAAERPVHRLILFVAGDQPNSARARANLEDLCATCLDEGHCEVRIVDVLTDYQTALEHQILVTPCLMKLEPQPKALVAGTLHDIDAVRTALRLPDT